MNYFNYFTEIEDEFVRRRGSHLLVSPLDWSLMEVWKQRGIPLHIVLRAINNAFDAYDKRPHRGRKVNSLMYCRQEVEACYLQYLESRVGAGETKSDDAAQADSPFQPAAILQYLTEQTATLERLAEGELSETLNRAAERLRELIDDLAQAAHLSYEGLEADLTLIEESILEGLRQIADPETLAAWEKEGKKQLRAYREGMKPEVYRQTLDNFIARKLREQYRIPRLSLFYLN